MNDTHTYGPDSLDAINRNLAELVKQYQEIGIAANKSAELLHRIRCALPPAYYYEEDPLDDPDYRWEYQKRTMKAVVLAPLHIWRRIRRKPQLSRPAGVFGVTAGEEIREGAMVYMADSKAYNWPMAEQAMQYASEHARRQSILSRYMEKRGEDDTP